MTYRNNRSKRRHRSGLILLIVLGMLALFTLLAVSYAVTAGASRSGTKAMEVRARNSGLNIAGTAKAVLNDVVRGTNNQRSPFYRTSLMDDVFGPNPIITQFGPYNAASPNSVRRFVVAQTGVNLVKVPLTQSAQLNGPLSDLENEYNSRVLTIMEGPLAGQSFRILKYVGYVRDGSGPADPNLDLTPWSNPSYGDPLAVDTRYSVLIDLNEVVGREFSGEYFDSADLTLKTASFSVDEWIARYGTQSLFFLQTGPAAWVGYKLLINDAPFNSPGIGLEDIASIPDPSGPILVPGFGNIDSRRLLRTNRAISPALLTHYDYLQDPTLMSTNPYDGSVGVDGIGTTRTSVQQSRLNGSSNEGFDVPDYRDPFLAHQSWAGGQYTITPSYHRPEVINYISHLFGNPSSLTMADVNEMLRLIDASTARVLSYPGKNAGFRENDPSVVRLQQSFTWSNPPTGPQIASLQGYVRNQIIGSPRVIGGNTFYEWDLDNDGDGIADSVWIDPSLPVVYAPDGRRLRPLAAVLIEDLDGRVNLNTAGDRVQGNIGHNPATSIGFDVMTNAYYKRQNQAVAQGFGYGPAEISLTALFQGNGNLLMSGPDFSANPGPNHFSFFDELTGARRYPFRPILFANVADRVPGMVRPAVFPDRSLSALSEREFHLGTQHSRLPGMPIARRGTFGMTYDRNGNPAFVNPLIVDGDPYNPGAVSFADETRNDKYESAAMEIPISDDPLGLRDLESILRRFDEDATALPSRLREKLALIPGYGLMDGINREITVRSGELRYPNLAAAMKTALPSASSPRDVTIAGQAPGTTMPSYLRYIQMLHSQRYRNQSFPAAATDDPILSNATLAELFPMDFSKGLRMDLNRPLGNGYDDNNNGEVDEPLEVEAAEQDQFPVGAAMVGATGAYSRDIKPTARKLNAQNSDSNSNANPFNSQTRARLGSRQILARNLYCLAQLIIPRDFEFPGMNGAPVLRKYRIRATAIAQWAVNVVDFRDADAAMTRFEFDILPFGSNSGSGLPVKVPGWAPDRIQHNMNKQFVGVVWGMEMPELLLTESLALHDKRLRDTDMDSTGKTTTDPMMPDDDFDQYRFPQSSLFLELYNPRTTAAATNALIPGVPSSLYDASMRLELDKLAPNAGGVWGRQPVWRIAMSDMYPANSSNHPQALLRATAPNNRAFETVTHQWSTEQVPGGTGLENALGGASNLDHTNNSLQYIEQYIGTDLRYDLSDPGIAPPVGFERFVWFTNLRPNAGQRIPDSLPAYRTQPQEHQSVFTSQSAGMRLGGGSYLVIAPRTQTNIGSLTHNQFTGAAYPAQLTKMAMATPENRPVLSPSYQRIDLDTVSPERVKTYLLNNQLSNQPWMNLIKSPEYMVCNVPAPSGWETAFPATTGIGLNVSFPVPVAGQTIWQSTNVPTTKLNVQDVAGAPGRPDNTPGFGAPTTPPDSWIDVSAASISNSLPDEPIDNNNPLLTGRRTTGTYENVRAAYLQRLADPEYPYDPVTNPYITVDWMSIDLTVFNGESTIGTDPNDTPGPIKFQSRYKDGSLSPLAANHDVQQNKGISYHTPMTGTLKTTPLQANIPSITVAGIGSPVNPESFFPYQLGYDKMAYPGNLGNSATTIGYCNAGYFIGAGQPTPAQMDSSNWANFDGFGPPLNDPTAIAAYRGVPTRMAGVTWFNRPFASPYELMMVPLTGPGTFGLHHSAYTNVQNREMLGFVPSYQTTNAWNVDLPMLPPADPLSLNSYWAKTEPLAAQTVRLADWPLLLEFVETQPPFIDANKFYRSDTMLALAPPADAVAARFLNSYIRPGYTLPDTGTGSDLAASEPYTVRGPSFLAPFNLKPSYVAAGKINLNTIAFDSAGHSRALKAIEHNYLAGERGSVLDSLATNFAISRQGYAAATGNAFFNNAVVHPAMDPNYPTKFVGAYRPAMSSNLAPVLAIPAATQKMRSRYGVESSLLRSLDPDTNTYPNATLQGNVNDRPLLFQATQVETQDRLDAVQPFVRMQRAMRLPNLVTNQSNVFAVWVTVSLHEYDPITGFGNEYIGETGLPQRERQFFIIDRTIPVGFKPGESLNTERTVLLQRTLP